MKGKEFRLFISDELHTKLKLLSVVEGKSMNQLIVESVEKTISVATDHGKLHKEMKI